MKQSFTYGSVRGAAGNGGPYRDLARTPRDGRSVRISKVGNSLSLAENVEKEETRSSGGEGRTLRCLCVGRPLPHNQAHYENEPVVGESESFSTNI